MDVVVFNLGAATATKQNCHQPVMGAVRNTAPLEESCPTLCGVLGLHGVPMCPPSLLAGDHLQLPPTVLSDAAAKAGLSCTLFERLQHSLRAEASCMLTVQYRMHAAIMDWSSQELYEVTSGCFMLCE